VVAEVTGVGVIPAAVDPVAAGELCGASGQQRSDDRVRCRRVPGGEFGKGCFEDVARADPAADENVPNGST